jgi:cytochrome c2
MDSPLKFYAKALGLFVVLLGVVAFNVAVWGLHRHPTAPAWYVPGASPERGRVLIEEYGCGACHAVPGVRGAAGRVGPPLDDISARLYIAGVVPNSPDDLVRWIRDPRRIDPGTAMPDLNVSERDARDIAAYLYELP